MENKATALACVKNELIPGNEQLAPVPLGAQS